MPKPAISAMFPTARISARVAEMGRQISRDSAGGPLDVVALLEDAFVFAADLVRHISAPVVCHFVRAEAHEVTVGGYPRKEIFFSHEPDLRGRNVLLVDAVLDTGVTLDFFAKRIADRGPRSVKLAVLFDRPASRRVDLRPDYVGFVTASNHLVGYGLGDRNGMNRNLAYVGSMDGSRKTIRKAARRAGKPRGRKSRKSRVK